MFKKILPKTFFYTGLAIFPPFLFTDSTGIRLILVLAIIAANILSGRKIRLLPNLLIIMAVIAANLYPPGGKVYFSLGPLYFTEDAILSGLRKSLLFIGSVYISRFAVRKELVFPGKTGILLYKTFFYFEKLTEMRLNVKTDIIGQIDSRLVEIESMSGKAEIEIHSFSSSSGSRDFLFFTVINVFFWALFAYSEIYLGRS